MANPDAITSAETGRTLRRGVKRLTITVDGAAFTYGQPGWWAAPDDPADPEGQLTDDDNVVRRAARREARALARHTMLTPLVIRAIREGSGLSQRAAGLVFGGGPKAFEKYEAGEVVPSAPTVRLLLLAARWPGMFAPGSGTAVVSEADALAIGEAVRTSSIGGGWRRIYEAEDRAGRG